MSLGELVELLHEYVGERFGALHGRVIKILWSYGPQTMFELAQNLRKQTFDVTPPQNQYGSQYASDPFARSVSAAVGSGLDDGSIKHAVALLQSHSVVSHLDSNKTYRLRVGHGILRCFLPVVMRAVHQRYGDAGAMIIGLLVEYGSMPSSTLQHMATQRRPALHGAVGSTVELLRRDGMIVATVEVLSSAAPAGGGIHGDESATKKSRKEEQLSPDAATVFIGGNNGTTSMASLAILSIHEGTILHRLRAESMIAFLAPQHDSASLHLLKAAFLLDTSKVPNGSTSEQEESHFPPRVDLSSSLSLLRIREHLPSDVRVEALIAALTRLSSGSTPLLLRSGVGNSGQHATTTSSDEAIRVRYDNIIEQFRLDICEQVIFSRYGTIGVRVMKLLLRNQVMEDRFLAEEAIATQQSVREVLAGMMRDGCVRQQEIPKVMSPDRQPKQSIFLWTMPKPLLLGCVSRQLVRSLRNARLRLRVEEERLHSKFNRHGGQPEVASSNSTTGVFGDHSTMPLSTTASTEKISMENGIRALKVTLFALMQHVLVMEFFGSPVSGSTPG